MSDQYPPSPQDPYDPSAGQPQYGYGGGSYPGAPQYGQQPTGAKPDSNLVWGILATVLCCLPFGIVSIVKASKVDGLWNSGQYAAAQQASADAKKWAIISAVVGLVVGVLYVIVAVLAGVSGA